MDPYVYPETNVLRNLRDIRDAGQLSKFEAIATTRRTIELEHAPLEGQFDRRHLQGMRRTEFNAVHPFRDGNGRTQREFIRELGFHGGLRIDWRQVSQQEMIESFRLSLRTDYAGLEQILRKALTAVDPQR